MSATCSLLEERLNAAFVFQCENEYCAFLDCYIRWLTKTGALFLKFVYFINLVFLLALILSLLKPQSNLFRGPEETGKFIPQCGESKDLVRVLKYRKSFGLGQKNTRANAATVKKVISKLRKGIFL